MTLEFNFAAYEAPRRHYACPIAADGGFLNSLALADQCDDATVVVGIHFAIEQVDAGHLHGVDDGVDFGLVAAFREVGDAFDERGHE